RANLAHHPAGAAVRRIGVDRRLAVPEVRVAVVPAAVARTLAAGALLVGADGVAARSAVLPIAVEKYARRVALCRSAAAARYARACLAELGSDAGRGAASAMDGVVERSLAAVRRDIVAVAPAGCAGAAAFTHLMRLARRAASEAVLRRREGCLATVVHVGV